MDAPVLVEVTRGPAVESRHRGQIVVMDARGQVVRQVGDPEALVCMRSLAKPFQALALLTTGAAKDFGFEAEELALCSGSLSGQDFQADLGPAGADAGRPAMRRPPALAPPHRPGLEQSRA